MNEPEHNLRALILEDSEDDARLAALTLERQGYALAWQRVETEEALLAALERATPDVILADHAMPRLDSARALELLHARRMEIPFILVSGTIGEEAAVAAMRQGASDYVAKGNLDRLGPAIQRARNELRLRREHRAAQEALTASEARYRALFEDAPEAIVLARGDRIVDCNARTPELFGRTREALIGRSIGMGEFSPPVQPDGSESDAKIRARRDAALAGEPQLFEWQILRGDGTLVMVEVVFGPIQWPDGSGLHVMLRDISERKELERRERTLSRALQQSADAIMITDADEVLEYVNPAFERITGYTAAEMVGRTPGFLAAEHDEPGVRERLRADIRAGREFHGVLVNRRRSGELYHADMSIAPVRDEGGTITHFIASHYDITDKLRTERELARLVHYDPVTDLPNRALLLDRLAHMLTQVQRFGWRVAVMHVDLDGFGLVNETWGRAGGDHVLRTVARRLVDAVGADTPVGRTGNDGFVVLALLTDEGDRAERRATSLQQALRASIHYEGEAITVTGTVGLALAPADATDAEALLRHAETALHRAQRQGREQMAFYAPAMSEEARNWLTVESGLRRALEQGEFRLEYQPQVDLHSGRMSGVEALLRWDDPERGLVSPGEFVPLLEATGLIVPVGEWVIREACRRIGDWRTRLATGDAGTDDIRVAVNLSLVQFERRDLLTVVREALEATGTDARCLELELTETSLARNPDEAARTLSALRELGVSVALDDFGVGYSSLNYLKRFPIDVVKIDRVFVDEVTRDAGDAAILRAVLELARSRDMKTVAEGVETEAQVRFLLAEGCRYVQGFLFSRPVGPAQLQRLLAREQPFAVNAGAPRPPAGGR